MMPDNFWDATLDECILMVKGKVDDWRFQRNCANLIHLSFVEKGADILQAIPLPFDWEIQQEKPEDDIFEQYKKITADW